MPYRIAIDARKIRDFGIGTYIRNLVEHLAEIDTENRYILLVQPRDAERFNALPENFECVVERSSVYSLRELYSLSWRLYRLNLDLYHATHYVLPLFVPCATVVTIHDIIHLIYPDFLPNRLAFVYAQRMMRRSLVRGDQILCVSRNTRDDLADYFALGREKLQVVYNGVEDLFRQEVPADDLRRRLGVLELKRPYVLFVGNPKPHKNLDNVVQAYARARQLHTFDAPLVVVGAREGSDFKIRQRAEQLGIGEKIRLLGHVAQEALPAVYQGASLFIFPTLYEGFGLPVVEAMASGVAVMTSNTSALKEIAEGYAELVNPLDVEAMAQMIAHLMKDEKRRRELAEKGLERAEDFRWSRTAEKTLEVYRRILTPRPPSSTPAEGP